MTVDQHVSPVAPALSQGTTIEQSRAVAEVQAAVIVAQQMPRNLPAVFAAMREACRQPELAARAFYRYPRAGKPVSGPSIHLARELARIWGNISHGITELARGEESSEMQAFAWDLERNSRVAHTFIVPHSRDTSDGIVPLPDLRSIYENNQNNGARRLREAIFAVLPGYYVGEAQDICRATIVDGGGKSLPQRISDAITAYDGIGVTADRLEAKVGRNSGRWTPYDVAQLGNTFKLIQRGEVLADDEFPDRRITAEDIVPLAPAGEPARAEWETDVRSAWLVDLDRAAAERDLQALQELIDTAVADGQNDLAVYARTELQRAAEQTES